MQPTPKTRRRAEQKRHARLRSARGEQRAGDRTDRHGRAQHAVLTRARVKDGDRHGRDEDREVEPERADQKQHQQRGLQIGPLPHILEAFDEAAARAYCAWLQMQFADAQHAQRTEHGDEGERVDQKHPARAHRGDEQPATAGPIMRAALNEVEFSATALDRSASPTRSETKV